MQIDSSLILLLNRLWHVIGFKRQLQIGLLLVFMFCASIAEMISIGAVFPFLAALTSPEKLFNNDLLRPFLFDLGAGNSSEILFPLTIIFIFSLVLSGVVRFMLLWYQTKISFGIGADISNRLFEINLYKPYYKHLDTNSSEVISMISNKANEVTSQVLMPTLTIVSSFFMILMILGTLLFINSSVAISAILGFGIIYYLIIKFTKNQLTADSKILNIESSNVIKILQEGLGNIRDVIIDGTQDTFVKLYRQSDLSLRKAKANVTIIGASPRFGIEALGMSLIAIIAYNVSKSEEGMFISNAIPILGAMALGAQRLLPVMQLVFTSWTFIRGCESSLNDTLLVLEEKRNSIVENEVQLGFQNAFHISNVSFSYNFNEPMVLSDINLSIKKGSKVGIIGSTGSGKSTLLDIVMGLLTPIKGKLFLDGVEIDEGNLRSWQRMISHVPQSIYLSDSSIAENIAFGISKEEIDYELVKSCSIKSELNQTIESWIYGYDTYVGERGIRLSGGQRQRIAIARALYKKSQVIIFDEATSALDNETEASVMESIESLNNELTILIVAHRLTTLKSCDYIIKMDNGKVASIGSYLDLIENKKYATS